MHSDARMSFFSVMRKQTARMESNKGEEMLLIVQTVHIYTAAAAYRLSCPECLLNSVPSDV